MRDISPGTYVLNPDKLISALLIEPELRAGAERTNPSVPDMWPSSLPDVMHERLKR
jgi:hypothetical protein